MPIAAELICTVYQQSQEFRIHLDFQVLRNLQKLRLLEHSGFLLRYLSAYNADIP